MRVGRGESAPARSGRTPRPAASWSGRGGMTTRWCEISPRRRAPGDTGGDELDPSRCALASIVLASRRVVAQEADLASLRAATKARPPTPSRRSRSARAAPRRPFVEASRELTRGSAARLGAEGRAQPAARLRGGAGDADSARRARRAQGLRRARQADRDRRRLPRRGLPRQNRASEALPLEVRGCDGAGALRGAPRRRPSFALQGKVAEAELTLRKLGEAVPSRPEANHWLGVFLLARGQRDAASRRSGWRSRRIQAIPNRAPPRRAAAGDEGSARAARCAP